MRTSPTGRLRRKLRIRKKVTGTQERPRLSVFRSAKHIYAQVINDQEGRTLASSSTLLLAKGLSDNSSSDSNSKVESAKSVGKALAEVCSKQGIDQVVFDRNGFRYHGRVRALADAAREAGLKF